MEFKTGDILINKEPHSCQVKFVEGCDKSGLLLVDGIKDEFFAPHEYHLANRKYQLLCKKEDRQDL